MLLRTVVEYLKRWGFTPQKPLKRACGQNPEAVKKWLDEEYPKIASKAKKEGAEIHWGDETGLCNTSPAWPELFTARQDDSDPAVRQKKRINLTFSITNQGKVPVHGISGYDERLRP